MRSRKLIVVDTETSGLDPHIHSVMAFGAVIYQDGGISGEFYERVNVPGTIYDREALEVNGLEAGSGHDPWLVVQRFNNWLLANELYGPQILVAHKVDFDVPFLQQLWRIAGANFKEQFGHRHLCTQSVALFLDQTGRINLPGGSASLDAVAEFYGLRRASTKHNALEDAQLTARVLAKLIEQIK